MALRRSPPPPPKADMTPMIDVVFLLLVFFLCTIEFKVFQGRIETELPKDAGEAAAEVAPLLDPLRLHLLPAAGRPEGCLVRDDAGRLHEVPALAALAGRYRAVTPEGRAVVSVEDEITHGQVVAVVDAVVRGGLSEIAFAAR